MCVTCGCGEEAAKKHDIEGGGDGRREDHGHAHDGEHVHAHGDGHQDGHVHAHGRAQDHHGGQGDPRPTQIIDLEARVLAKNDALAARNRAWFAGREILALNLVSSPGAGKTSLLVRTIQDMGKELELFVVEGDQATSNDSERICAAGAPVVQLNTGTGCHLDADMLARGLRTLSPPPGSVVMIENVGNLVCPALFDLGERAKVAVLSVAEGDDKPEKYPYMFRAAELLVLNKIDLLPHVDFDVERAIAHARAANPAITVLVLSVRTGDGLSTWYDWIRSQFAAARRDKLADQRGADA